MCHTDVSYSSGLHHVHVIFMLIIFTEKCHSMLWSTNLKEIETNDDMCHSLTQTTSFSTDFETLQE